MMAVGLVEIISTDFVSGWHDLIDERPALLYASLDGRVIGFGEASIQRRDLVREAEQGLRDARAFLISFKEPLPSERLHEITVRDVQSGSVLSRGLNVKSDRNPKQQIFVLGSPRSGTSELGSTLASQLQLPWLGEGHAAPLFAQAAEAMAGDRKSANGFVRDIAEQDYARVIVETAQKAYYNIHASASFVDKTPGIPMIAAAPFLLQCFPKAKWIYLSRNGIANVLSRLEKFGGSFDSHCLDWAGAMNLWDEIRKKLPHSLELRQEDMLERPDQVGAALASYLEEPSLVTNLALSLRKGSTERTGAGIGRQSLAETGWSPDQMNRFRRLCGPTMDKFGYSFDT